MATPEADGKNGFPGRHADFRPRARPCVGAGGFAKGSIFSADGMATGPRTARRRCCAACRPTSRSANCDVNPRAHDGSLSRRSRCLGLDALASARFDRGASCRRGRPVCSHARCRRSRLPFLPACLRSRRLSAGAGPARGGGGRLLPDWTQANPRRGPARRSHRSRHHRRRGRDSRRRSRERPACSARSMSSKDSRLGAKLLVPDLLAGGSTRVRAATRYLRHGEGRRLWQSFLAHLESSQATRRVPRRGHRRRKNGVCLVHRRASEAGLRARRVAAETADAD